MRLPADLAAAVFLCALGQAACTTTVGPKPGSSSGRGGAATGGVTSTAGSTAVGGAMSGGAAGSGGGGTSGMEVSVSTVLPPLPTMENVVASAVDDNVNITFDPVDGARDYRVYVLPSDKDVSSDSSGHVTVTNAIYRCAGDRQASQTTMDGAEQIQGNLIKTLVDGQAVDGYTRTLADATLGYVYSAPGAGRVPVYAMGDSAANGDVDCDFLGGQTRWTESRAKQYVTSDSTRQDLLTKGWRDDGIVFFVPAAAGANTRNVNTSLKIDGTWETRYYFLDGAEATARGQSDVAFQVLSDGSEAGTLPLMRVFYQNGCGRSHDELVVGQARFERARKQGDQLPVYNLHWAGITAETTLVVEALAEGCPYQGFFAPLSQPARDPYPQWLTFDETRAASPTGEVYINGQHDAANNPKPIARSFVKVSPGAKPDLDWFEGFSDAAALGTLAETPCADGAITDRALTDNCWQSFRQVSDRADVSFMFVETDRWGLTPELGELWVAFGDVAGGVNGKIRLTPTQKATLASDTFLYATMTIDTFTTSRRYPQIIISEADAPVQYNMELGHALVFQTFGGWPNTFQLEVCDHQYWDVNKQCPAFDLHHILDPDDSANILGLYPNQEAGEYMGLDRGTRLEVYASDKRAYLFLGGEPFGCADLPSTTVPAGPVTVTFGDVLYHSGVDYTFSYTAAALQLSTRRHYDNLGFKSGVPAPSWDEQRFPCAKHLKL